MEHQSQKPSLRRVTVLLPALFVLLTAMPAPARASTSFAVNGKLLWQDTGVDVLQGERIVITATGSIHFKTGEPNAPPEWPGGPTFNPSALLPTSHVLSLTGRIGTTPVLEGKTGFGNGFIGASYDRFAPVSGRLYLAFNDSYFPDNSGSYQTTITVSAANTPALSPEGTALALGLLLLGTAGFRFRRGRGRRVAARTS